MILDEPTNHLDIATIEWLETYLKSYRGALLFVSHDRYFIDALANKIVEIDNHAAEVYKGNYSFYVEEKKIRYQNMLSAYNNQQREIAKLKRFIEFYKPKPRFVSRAKDREKKLEHMKILDKPYENKNKLKLNFHGESLVNKEIIKVDDVTVGYSQPLIEHINFSLFGQNKIAIMGSNGCGKTTLLEAIVSLKHILQGEIRYLRQINIGYIKQHQVDLNPDLTVAEELLKDFPSLGEKGVYNHLGKFNFDYEDANKKIGFLSGGEKMRVVLAKIILENYDVLLILPKKVLNKIKAIDFDLKFPRLTREEIEKIEVYLKKQERQDKRVWLIDRRFMTDKTITLIEVSVPEWGDVIYPTNKIINKNGID